MQKVSAGPSAMTEMTDRRASYLIYRILITAIFVTAAPPLCSHRGAPPSHPSHFLLYLSSKLISVLPESFQFADFSETRPSSSGKFVGVLGVGEGVFSTLRNDRGSGKAMATIIGGWHQSGESEEINHVGDLGALEAEELGSGGQSSSEHDF